MRSSSDAGSIGGENGSQLCANSISLSIENLFLSNANSQKVLFQGVGQSLMHHPKAKNSGLPRSFGFIHSKTKYETRKGIKLYWLVAVWDAANGLQGKIGT